MQVAAPERLHFAALGRELSRLVLGTLVLSTAELEAGAALLDEYVRLGGNVIDTAHVYGDGDCERALGAWLERRGALREQLVVVSKGAHPAGDRRRVTPEEITRDLRESVERLGGPIDLYLLHRDDPSVPVGVLLECLNEHREANLLRAFGTSNWTTARIDEANAYAAAHGLEGFCVSSQHLSLATQNEDHWPDTRSANEPAIHEWHVRTQTPLLAWSAQARGYFAGRGPGRRARLRQRGEPRAAPPRGAGGPAARPVSPAGRARVDPEPAVPGVRGLRRPHRGAGARGVRGARDRSRQPGRSYGVTELRMKSMMS
jgi:aryl-alcohol dehydrogenase-like predicted oxidoreductase